jgi:hypothetical protein
MFAASVLRLLLWLAVFVFVTDAEARSPNRNPETPRAFQRAVPCPATGLRYGACPGWERDHVKPLCAGGPDTVANMQWLTKEQHARKTRLDVQRCRYFRQR